jgi:hypothetical protein
MTSAAWSPRSEASSSREFVMSCTYGVLAGTLVGAATLAFESQPADKLYKVARGASLGLYAGILLGFYVVYGVSENEPNMYNEPGLPPEGRHLLKKNVEPRWAVQPLLDEHLRLDGAVAQMQVWKF